MPILDVAIGMVFIFLVLSLVVTAFNELIAAWLKRRSKTLWRGIVRLVGNEKFAASLYAHPLIASLGQSATGRPSYIPSRTFVMAVLDGLTAAGAPPPATIQEVTAAVNRLPPELQGLGTTLTVLLHDSAGNMEEFKRVLEQWFDNSMERVSGWYKRQTQWILLAISLCITIWTNADAVGLTNTLWTDPAVRSALVAQAQQYADQQRRENVPAAAQATAGPPPPPALPPAEAPELETASANFDKSVDRLHSLALPLGWGNPADPKDKREAVPGWAQVWPTIESHVLGWLLTTLAISLGAPFWFDMLNKVISIRSSGKAPEEKPKPPKEVPTPTEPGGAPAGT